MLSILLFDPEIEGLSNPELVATFRQQQIRMTRRYLKRCSYEDNLKIIQEYIENIRKVCRVEKNYNPLKNCFSSLQFIYYLFRLWILVGINTFITISNRPSTNMPIKKIYLYCTESLYTVRACELKTALYSLKKTGVFN